MSTQANGYRLTSHFPTQAGAGGLLHPIRQPRRLVYHCVPLGHISNRDLDHSVSPMFD